MKQVFLLFILFVWFPAAHGAVNIELMFEKNDIQQGSIETATARLTGESLQKINLQKLKGQTLGETLYLHNVSPLLRKEGSKEYESEFKVIFIKVPESSQIVQKFENDEINLKWSPVKVTPIEVPEKLIFEQFEIPEPLKVLKWMIGLVLMAGLVFGFIKIKKFREIKNKKRSMKKSIKDSIMAANSYEEIVTIWKRKLEITEVFPALGEPFKELEKTLFKFQFRPHQTEDDKNEVKKAYGDFLNAIQGGFDGI